MSNPQSALNDPRSAIRRTRASFAAILGACLMAVNPASALDLTAEQKSLSVVEAPPSALTVSAQVNKPTNQYGVGDFLDITLRSNKDAYVTIFNVDASGRVTLILPNEFEKDNRIKANTDVTIPGATGKFRLKVGDPKGPNLIKIVASTRKAAFGETLAAAFVNGFKTFEAKASDVARDIEIIMADAADVEWASASVPFEVVSK